MSVDDVRNQTATGRLANYGGNPFIPYDPRPMDYGNRVGQGSKSRLLHTDFTASYQPRLNLFLDAKLIARHQTYSLTPTANAGLTHQNWPSAIAASGAVLQPSVAVKFSNQMGPHKPEKKGSIFDA